jgi:hypothetical protein
MAAEANRGRLAAIIGLAGGLTLLGASAPAQAQFFGSWWGGWHSEPGPYAAAPIPPRRVASIVASEGFALSAPPQRRGDVILADGVDRQGQHMRFVIDAYDGEILRGRVAGPPRPPALIGNGEPAGLPPQAHARLMPGETGPTALPGAGPRAAAGPILGGAQPGLEPMHPLAKPKAPPKPKQTAAHTPPKAAATAPIPRKVPSQAEQVKEPVPAPSAQQEPATSPTSATEAKAAPAAAASPATPLAPDAAPINVPAAPVPAAVEAKAPVPAPAQDIGPTVKKVDPAPTAAIPAPPTQSDTPAPESR